MPCSGATFAGATGLANAIINAESGTASPTIDLTPGCTYTFTAPDSLAAHVPVIGGGATTVDLDGWYGPDALPAIATAVTIEGNGATIARSSATGTPPFRLFFVGADPTSAATHNWTTPGAGSLMLTDLTLSGGLAEGGSADGGGGGLGAGGAIYDQGTVTLNRVTLSGDEALGGTGGVVALNSDGGAGMGTNSGSGGAGGSFGGGFVAPAGASTGGPYLSGAGNGGGASGGGFASGENGTSAPGIGGAAGGGADTGTGGAGGFRLGVDSAGGSGGDGSGGGGSGYGTPPGGSTAGGGFGVGGTLGMTSGGTFPGGGGGGVGGGGGASYCAGGGGGGFGGGGGYSVPTATSGSVTCPVSASGRVGLGGFGAGRGGAGVGDGRGGDGGFGAGGGGIGAEGGGGGAGLGGAIFDHNGTLSATNTTLSGDTAVGGPVSPSGGVAGTGMGGAIFDLDGTATLTNSTLAGNTADNGGALYVLGYDHTGASDPASATLIDDVLSGSAEPGASLPPADLLIDAPTSMTAGLANADVSTATSTTPNIVQLAQASGSGELTGSVRQVAPQLSSSLSYNGGPGMLTLLPGPGSPMLGAGTSVGAPSVDERGLPRPAGGPIDLGAVQVSGNNLAPPSCASVARTVAAGTPTTITLSCAAPNQKPLILSIVGAPAHGKLGSVNQAGGTVLYTPAAGFAGQDSFSYRASEGTLDSNPAVVRLTVGASTTTPPSAVPVISAVTQSASKWLESNRLASISKAAVKKLPVGTTFSFRLSEAASVKFAFTRPVLGRRVGKHCVAQTKHNNKKRRCTIRTVTAATLAFKGHAGVNKVRFRGRVSQRVTLKPRAYTLVITATASKTSAPHRLKFTIASPPKRKTRNPKQ